MTDQRTQRIIAELLLPALGVMFWQWSPDFILWYMLLDGLAGIVVGRIHPLQRNRREITALQIGECCLTLVLIHYMGPSVLESLNNFFFYKDLGLPQGYVLVPLLVLGEWIKWVTSKKLGVYFFNRKSAYMCRIAFLGVVFGLSSFGVQDFYLSLSLIFLSSSVILFIRQDVILI